MKRIFLSLCIVGAALFGVAGCATYPREKGIAGGVAKTIVADRNGNSSRYWGDEINNVSMMIRTTINGKMYYADPKTMEERLYSSFRNLDESPEYARWLAHFIATAYRGEYPVEYLVYLASDLKFGD